MYAHALSEKMLWFKMMISVAGMWLATIFGPALVDPDIYILLYFSMLCLLGVAGTIKKNFEINFLISGSGVFICTLLLVKLFLDNSTITWGLLLGLFLGLLGGALNYIYSVQSFNFIKLTQFSVTQVLAIRFWLVELFCLPLIPKSALYELNLYTSFLIIIIAFSSLILPIYFSIKSVATIGPERSAIIFGSIPLATYLVQFLSMRHFDWTILLLNALTGFFIALPYILRMRFIRKK